jgi:hypothetical protein
MTNLKSYFETSPEAKPSRMLNHGILQHPTYYNSISIEDEIIDKFNSAWRVHLATPSWRVLSGVNIYAQEIERNEAI